MNDEEREIINELIKRFVADDYDPTLLDRFQEWLSNPVNEEIKEEALRHVWEDMPAYGSRLDAERAFEKVKIRAGITKPKTGKRISWTAWRVAAIIAVPLMILSGIFFTERTVQPEAHEVVLAEYLEEGSNYKLLQDGSEVWTAHATALTEEGERQNKLAGDALYNVKREHVEGRRFTVTTEHLTVTVLGTVFRLTALPDTDQTIITLYEGILEITLPDGSHIINTGTRFSYDNNTGEYQTENIGNIWPEQIPDRILEFRSENISSVFREIERLYGVSVDPSGYSRASESVTLKFSSATNLENVLYMLSGITGNLGYRMAGDSVYIYDNQ